MDSKLENPSELSDQEYRELCQQIREELSLEECREELLEAARHNDVDVVRALCHCHPQIVGYQDPKTGNTALHMAAANGHAESVKLLLNCGADTRIANQKGNTPLHWAAANGQQAVVELLLQQKEIDVLQRNSFGRSALTEGFTSENTDMVQALLQHESASEEKLIETSSLNSEDSVTHVFLFQQVSLKIRELAIAKDDQDTILGQANPQDDTTGLGIWAASLVCAQWMARQTERFANKTIIELGSGCGVPGLTIAKSVSSARVYLTDFNPKTVENESFNIQLNECMDNTEALIMNWQDRTSWPKQQIEIVVGSDLIYQSDMVPLLVQTLQALLPSGGVFLYVAPETGRQGHDDFLTKMEQNFRLNESQATPDLLSNPLSDDDLFFLHFHEIQSMAFRLYEFTKK